jgi:hypothetical protein
MDAANRSELFTRTIPCGLTRRDAATMMRSNGTLRSGRASYRRRPGTAIMARMSLMVEGYPATSFGAEEVDLPLWPTQGGVLVCARKALRPRLP